MVREVSWLGVKYEDFGRVSFWGRAIFLRIIDDGDDERENSLTFRN